MPPRRPSENTSSFFSAQPPAAEEAASSSNLTPAQKIRLARQAQLEARQELYDLTINNIIQNCQQIIDIHHADPSPSISQAEKDRSIALLCGRTIRSLPEIIEENEYRLLKIKFPRLFSLLEFTDGPDDPHPTPRIDRIHTIMAFCGGKITFEQITKIPNEAYLNALCSPSGLLALKANLFNLDKLEEIPFLHFLALLNPYGIQAVQERWIKLAEIKEIPLDYLVILLTESGFDALTNRLITTQDVKELPSSDHLQALLTESGLDALDNRLISISGVKIIPSAYLKILFDPDTGGKRALEERLISPEEISKMPSEQYLSSLLTPEGLYALRNNPQTGKPLIAPEEASQLIRWEYLNALLSEHGLQALSEHLITVKDVIDDIMTVNEAIKASTLTRLVALLEDGLMALREGLITLKATRAMTLEELQRLLKEQGLPTLRARAQEVSPLPRLSENPFPRMR
jgi:hypothetical protein